MVMWGGLATTAVMVLLIGVLAKLQNKREARSEGRVRVSTVDCARLVAEAIALDEAAAVALESAQRAATTHEQIIMDLAACEADMEAAWLAHSRAEAAYAAAAAHQGHIPLEQAVTDETQREISMAARAAYKRGDISAEELRAVWQTVEGWNQDREEREQELLQLRAEEKEAWRRYHVAAHAERSARRAVELAEVAARALIEDATDAARRAEYARIMAADCSGRVSRQRPPSPRAAKAARAQAAKVQAARAQAARIQAARAQAARAHAARIQAARAQAARLQAAKAQAAQAKVDAAQARVDAAKAKADAAAQAKRMPPKPRPTPPEPRPTRPRRRRLMPPRRKRTRPKLG
jgi:hypothetical protein